MMQNSLRLLFAELEKGRPKNVREARELVVGEEKNILKRFDESLSRIAEFGAEIIPKNAKILVHCHSHTVVAAILRANELGKSPVVTCCETRPRFQGRVTAKELSEVGIDTTLVVDSAAKTVLAKTDLVLVGADSITSIGDLINKIGTAGIASLARETEAPFYSCAELYKFDPLTIWGRMTEIEERSPEEILPKKEAGVLKRVKIKNFAFDRTSAKFISGYVTEKGVFSPDAMVSVALREFHLG
jgi:ribose 1,5-bisphosphate isomerase